MWTRPVPPGKPVGRVSGPAGQCQRTLQLPITASISISTAAPRGVPPWTSSSRRSVSRIATAVLPPSTAARCRLRAVSSARENWARSFSHMRALEAARSSRGAAIHIMEDDAQLSEHVRPVIEDSIAAGLFQRFDILFTDILAPPHLGMLKALKSAFDRVEMSAKRPLRLSDLQVIDLAGQNFSCLTSYVVGAKSIDRMLALYAAEGEERPLKAGRSLRPRLRPVGKAPRRFSFSLCHQFSLGGDCGKHDRRFDARGKSLRDRSCRAALSVFRESRCRQSESVS